MLCYAIVSAIPVAMLDYIYPPRLLPGGPARPLGCLRVKDPHDRRIRRPLYTVPAQGERASHWERVSGDRHGPSLLVDTDSDSSTVATHSLTKYMVRKREKTSLAAPSSE